MSIPGCVPASPLPGNGILVKHGTPSMKLHSKNFKDYSSDLCQKKRNDMRIPGICVIKSTHGGKKELFNILLFLKGKLSLFLRVFGGSFPENQP